jgi:DNA (cytosine-5)-methyltransferase 1
MIRFFDMFSGIGGFRAGLERAGGFECVGHCEIDKHADRAYRSVYNVKGSEVFYEDATKIDTNTLPEFDLLAAGFPCQAFSIAGKRQGFRDPRGTLFFEIARLVRARKPAYLLLENVPGLLSHDEGRTFAAILGTLCKLGYGVEWQVLNSKDFGVPQSRRRVYIVGYLDPRCAGKILPVRETNTKTLIQFVGGKQGFRVYDSTGLATTLQANSGGYGGKTGLYFIDFSVKEPKITSNARCLTARYDRGIGNRKAESSGVLELVDQSAAVCAVTAPEREKAGQNGRCDEPMFTLTGRIRRLTPEECFRLQGFSDDQMDKLLENTSDAQAYKQAGNAVTVNVVHALGLRLKAAHRGCVAATRTNREAIS